MNSPDKTTEDIIRSLVYIGELTKQIEDLNEQLREHVSYARQQGATWRQLGVGLGVSYQGAWERYSGHERDSEIPQQDALLTHEQVQDQSWTDIRPSAEEQARLEEVAEQVQAIEAVHDAAEIIRSRADH